MPDTSQNPPEPQPGAVEWLSVAEASARLKVSDRTVKRRIEAGTIESKLENLPRGGQRRLVALPIEQEGQQARDTRDSNRDNGHATERDERDSASDKARDTWDSESNAGAKGAGQSGQDERGDSANARDNGANGESDTRGPAIEARLPPSPSSVLEVENAALRDALERERQQTNRERELNTFLRGLIEQRDRDAAELRATLREALRAQPRQIEQGNSQGAEVAAGESSTIAPAVAQDALQSPQSDARDKVTATGTNGQHRDPARRGQGLAFLREGFKRILGR